MTFFLIFSSFLTLIYLYTGLRLIPSLFKKKTAIACWCLLILSMISLFAHIYLRVNHLYPPFSRVCAWTGYSGLGLVSYLFCLTFLRDLIILPPLLFKTLVKKTKQWASKPSKTLKFKTQRRSFMLKVSGYSIAALGSCATGLGWAKARQAQKL